MDSRIVRLLLERCPFKGDGRPDFMRRFVHQQTDPAVGWMCARSYAKARMEFPISSRGRQVWVFYAYLMFLKPERFYDPVVEEARKLSMNPDSSLVKAMIVAGLGEKSGTHLKAVSQRMNIPVEVIEAFETLFFNVLDRHEDGLYLAHLAYPHGRPVQLDEDYFATTPVADLLLRAGYDHRDMDFVEHLAGLDADQFKKALAGRECIPTEMEAAIFGNVRMAMDLGMANQKHQGLDDAVSLLAKQKSRGKMKPASEMSPDYDMGAELNVALKASGSAISHGVESGVLEQSKKLPAGKEEAGEGGHVDDFPEPVKAIWKSKDFDKPVMIMAVMRAADMEDHFLTVEGVGLPASEVFFGCC